MRPALTGDTFGGRDHVTTLACAEARERAHQIIMGFRCGLRGHVRSIQQLRRWKGSGAPQWIRTTDLRLRRPSLIGQICQGNAISEAPCPVCVQKIGVHGNRSPWFKMQCGVGFAPLPYGAPSSVVL